MQRNNDVVTLLRAVFRGQGDVFGEVVMGFMAKQSAGKVNTVSPAFSLNQCNLITAATRNNGIRYLMTVAVLFRRMCSN